MYVGVDPSTKTGVVGLDVEGKYRTTVLQFPKQRGLLRVQSIAQAFYQTMNDWRPQAVVIEGYAFANRWSLVDMVEIGVNLRMCMYTLGIPWYIAPPSVVKKYATGKGNSKKAQVAEAVRTRWAFEDPSDDVVDAYVMARIAQQLAVSGATKDLKGVENGERALP